MLDGYLWILINICWWVQGFSAPGEPHQMAGNIYPTHTGAHQRWPCTHSSRLRPTEMSVGEKCLLLISRKGQGNGGDEKWTLEREQKDRERRCLFWGCLFILLRILWCTRICLMPGMTQLFSSPDASLRQEGWSEVTYGWFLQNEKARVQRDSKGAPEKQALLVRSIAY